MSEGDTSINQYAGRLQKGVIELIDDLIDKGEIRPECRDEAIADILGLTLGMVSNVAETIQTSLSE